MPMAMSKREMSEMVTVLLELAYYPLPQPPAKPKAYICEIKPQKHRRLRFVQDDSPDPRSTKTTDEQIAQLLGGEIPLIVQAKKIVDTQDEEDAFLDLFSVMYEDVDMASLCSSSWASTRHSKPPISEFAADSDVEKNGNDAESDEYEIELPRHQPASSKLSKREEAFQKEQCKVGSSESKSKKTKRGSRFAAVLDDIVLDRQSHIRTPAQSVAFRHIAGFELGVGVRCTEKVRALSPDDLYIYPRRWEMEQFEENTSKPTWVIDRKLIYQDAGFMDFLEEAFFDSGKDFGFKYVDEFKSSIEKRPEPELMIPVVSLAATGYFAAIQA
ncbi:hypothetical protein CVT26_002244 [Gymnopilus dilepis]|uniref:DUF6532 domain-containing protein n=1 Tax=Gymnopilus dilepis TaxID=231916 RepID=A0A409YN07_9AGAR|nr:hypothetical protein CVT26_002244 [Gymnopilus dilepis]